MINIEKHTVICNGYKQIVKGFEKITRKYRKKGLNEEADKFELIADEFRKTYEKYKQIIDNEKRR